MEHTAALLMMAGAALLVAGLLGAANALGAWAWRDRRR